MLDYKLAVTDQVLPFTLEKSIMYHIESQFAFTHS